MKNLIKVQSAVMKIEEVTGLNTNYKSEFLYESDRCMVIKTFCKEQAIPYMMIFSRTPNVSLYFRSNCEIEIIDMEKD